MHLEDKSINFLLFRVYTFIQSSRATYLLIALWLIVQIYIYQNYGIRIVNDSQWRYLPNANAFTFHYPFVDEHELRYIGYIFFLYIFFQLGSSLNLIILMQVLISGCAAIALYKLTFSISRSKAAAFISTFLFIAWKDIQYLNYFVLTESLFTSFLIFSFYALLKARNVQGIILGTCIFVYTCIIRPNGFVVVIGILVFFIIKNRKVLKQHKLLINLLLLILIPLGLLLLNSWLHVSFYIVEEYQKGEIIYGAPQFALVPDKDLWMPASTTPALLKIVMFIYHNPAYFCRLACTKILYFLGYIKPYHSFIHQIATVLVLYPMYFFTIISLHLKNLPSAAQSFGATVLLTQTVIIALTVEDWDNRFIIPFLSYFFLLGAIGLDHALVNYMNRTHIKA